MPKYGGKTAVNKVRGTKYQRLRIKAGPLRDLYVDTLILEAKLGRKLLPGMTVEHMDGNPLNVSPNNLREVTREENTILMLQRRGSPLAARCADIGNEFAGGGERSNMKSQE